MTQFDYIAVLVSVVVGLGIVHLLAGVAALVTSERREPYWVHLLWTWNVFHYLVFYWWFFWRWSAIREWQLLLFLFVLIFAVAIYFLCAVLYPPLASTTDYRELYYRNRTVFFGLWVILVLLDIADTRLKQAYGLSGFGPLLVGVWITLIAGSVVAARSSSHRVHAAWGVAFFGIMAVFEYANFSVLRAD